MTVQFSPYGAAVGSRLMNDDKPGNYTLSGYSTSPITSDTNNKHAAMGPLIIPERPEEPLIVTEISCRMSTGTAGTGEFLMSLRKQSVDSKYPDMTTDGLLGTYTGPAIGTSGTYSLPLEEYDTGRLTISHGEKLGCVFELNPLGIGSSIVPYYSYFYNNPTGYSSYLAIYTGGSWSVASALYQPCIILHGIDGRIGYISEQVPNFGYSSATFNSNSSINLFGMIYTPDRPMTFNAISVCYTTESISLPSDVKIAAYRYDGTLIDSKLINGYHVGVGTSQYQLSAIFQTPFSVDAHEPFITSIEAMNENNITISINNYANSATEPNDFIKSNNLYNYVPFCGSYKYTYRFSNGVWAGNYEVRRRFNISPHIYSYDDVPAYRNYKKHGIMGQ